MDKQKGVKSTLTGKTVSNEKTTLVSDERRKAVRNILAGSGLTLGAATAGQWAKPVVDSIVTPAHAQTSTTVVLVGNANVSPVTMITPSSDDNSLLDFFIAPANAQASGPNLAGACLIMSVSGNSFTINVTFVSDPMVSITGTVSGGSINGSGSGITVTGTINLAASVPTASGTVSNSSGAFSFSLDTSQTNCTPIASTTTAAPTTTGSPTTTTGTPTTTTGTPTTTTGTPTTVAPTTTAAPPTTGVPV